MTIVSSCISVLSPYTWATGSWSKSGAVGAFRDILSTSCSRIWSQRRDLFDTLERVERHEDMKTQSESDHKVKGCNHLSALGTFLGYDNFEDRTVRNGSLASPHSEHIARYCKSYMNHSMITERVTVMNSDSGTAVGDCSTHEVAAWRAKRRGGANSATNRKSLICPVLFHPNLWMCLIDSIGYW